MVVSLYEALAQVPSEEKTELRRYLAGKHTSYNDPYGFTSQNIMVRGLLATIKGLDNPVPLSRLRKTLGKEA